MYSLDQLTDMSAVDKLLHLTNIETMLCISWASHQNHKAMIHTHVLCGVTLSCPYGSLVHASTVLLSVIYI